MLHTQRAFVLFGLTLAPILNAASAQELTVYTPNTVSADAQQIAETAYVNDVDNAVRVTEGDVLTHSVSLQAALQQRGIGVSQPSSIWPNGVVPYYLDTNLDAYTVSNIRAAIDQWNSLAGIYLTEIDPIKPDSSRDFLHFISAAGCASWIGRQGGAQTIWAAPSCNTGSMMHEIGHALGLEHEHTRPDRDQYIKVNWENVAPDKRENFDLSIENKQSFGAYDYHSIMHYGEYFFSANNGRTIEAVQPTHAVLGQRVAPSAGDLDSIARLYGTDLSLSRSTTDTANQTLLDLSVTNESQQGANNIDISVQLGEANVLSLTGDAWDCTVVTNDLICQLDILPGSTQSTLAIELDRVVSQDELALLLTSNTPDSNLANNTGHHSPPAANAEISLADQATDSSAKQLFAADSGGLRSGATGFWFLSFGLMLFGFRRFSRTA